MPGKEFKRSEYRSTVNINRKTMNGMKEKFSEEREILEKNQTESMERKNSITQVKQ
jgi:hypothetical protein